MQLKITLEFWIAWTMIDLNILPETLPGNLIYNSIAVTNSFAQEAKVRKRCGVGMSSLVEYSRPKMF